MIYYVNIPALSLHLGSLQPPVVISERLCKVYLDRATPRLRGAARTSQPETAVILPFKRPQSLVPLSRPAASSSLRVDPAADPVALCELHDILFEGRAPGEGQVEALLDRARGAAR